MKASAACRALFLPAACRHSPSEIAASPTSLTSSPATDRSGDEPTHSGRTVPYGTVLDPATTRAVTAGAIDPVSGRAATQSGFVRDPFGSCGPSTSVYSLTACGLNQLPAGRLDPNAVKLLNLYPVPTTGGFTNNFTNSPSLFEHKNAFDVRVDFNPSAKDQVFGRFSYADDPQFIPGIFGGIADGGGFQQGDQTYKSYQSVLGYTHVFTPTTINVVRVGFNHLHTTRTGPEGNTRVSPRNSGSRASRRVTLNGGLPAIEIAGLNELGSNDFLPSDEISQTLQVTDDFTKIYGKNSFKMGMEYQDVNFNTLQPAFSRGQFDFDGNYAGVPSQTGDQTGRAAMLLTPTLSTVGGPNGIGGANQVHASNICEDLRPENLSGVLLPGRRQGHPNPHSQSGPPLGLFQSHLRDEWRAG